MEGFRQSFVAQLAKLSATASALLALLAAGAAVAAVKALPWYFALPLGVIAVIVAIAALLAFTRKVLVIYPRRRPQLELACKRLTYVVHEESPTQVTYRKYYKVRAMVDGVTCLTDYYLWSGSDPARPKLVSGVGFSSDGFRIHHLGPDAIWEKYQIDFPNELAKKEECEFELEWTLDNSDSGAQCFVSSPINEPTHKLEFDLTLPNSWFPQRVWCETKRSIDSTHTFASKQLTREGDYIKWSPSNPRMYHYYMIKWVRNGSSTDSDDSVGSAARPSSST